MSLYNIFLLSFVEIFGDFQLEKYANTNNLTNLSDTSTLHKITQM